jgi:hypothetical protein
MALSIRGSSDCGVVYREDRGIRGEDSYNTELNGCAEFYFLRFLHSYAKESL